MMTKEFFSRKRAETFAEIIRSNGGENVRISAAKDAFGQTRHRVEWTI